MTDSYIAPHRTSPDNVIHGVPDLRLPLAPSNRVSGDAGFGQSAPGFLATDAGIVVTRRGTIGLFSTDLATELWSHEVVGWSNDDIAIGDEVWYGVVDRHVHCFSLRNGELIDSFDYDGGRIVGAEARTCIISRAEHLQGVDWSGQTLWNAEIAPSGLKAHFGGRLYASALDPFRRALLCISALTGEVLWRATLPTEGTGDAAMMSGTVGPVAATTDRVLVIPSDGRRLIVLAAESGEIESIERLPALPARGHFVVTEKEVVLFHPFMLSFFDHREMKETRRLELRDEVQPLYGDHPPIAHAFCLAQNAVIWTTPHGAFMGIHLEPEPDGRRITWVEELPGALMPVVVPPVVHDGRMYYTNMGEPLELMCYVSGR